MGRYIHQAAIHAGRFILSQCMRSVFLNRDRLPKTGPFVIACTHVSHVEPSIVSCLLNRRIHWMARLEFFRHPLARATLRLLESFPVNRQGIPITSIRESLRRLNQGKIVGIFPEGGVATGSASVMRGGPIKLGACLVARRAKLPIYPIIVIGTEKLNRVEPWLPIGKGKVWLNVGQPVQPLTHGTWRQTRAAMGEQLRLEFMRAYDELRATAGLDDSLVP
jgi:1-acyl-sn-glycerol-3-phosphate acyltransferase